MSIFSIFKQGLVFRLLRKCKTMLYPAPPDVIGKFSVILSEKPLDAASHYDFAEEAMGAGLYNIAHAELKNAEFLGLDTGKVSFLGDKISGYLSDLTTLDVNQYQRFTIMRTHLNKLIKSGESVLDIGGGHGILSQFIPDNRYFLIEPSVNGVSGFELPFEDGSFDIVVTCHVLEHISADKRQAFIDELLRVSSKNVLLFNPFKNDKLDEVERLKLILDVTDAPWAREHLECGLPRLEEVTDYLSSQDLNYTVSEYGDMYAALATVMMSYFAGKYGSKDLSKINQHFNLRYDQLRSSEYPTNIMIEIFN